MWRRRNKPHTSAENRPSPKPRVAGSSPAGPVEERPAKLPSRPRLRQAPGPTFARTLARLARHIPSRRRHRRPRRRWWTGQPQPRVRFKGYGGGVGKIDFPLLLGNSGPKGGRGRPRRGLSRRRARRPDGPRRRPSAHGLQKFPSGDHAQASRAGGARPRRRTARLPREDAHGPGEGEEQSAASGR